MSMNATDPFFCLFFIIDCQYTKDSWNGQHEIKLQNAICHCPAYIIKMWGITPYYATEGNKCMRLFDAGMLPIIFYCEWNFKTTRNRERNYFFNLVLLQNFNAAAFQLIDYSAIARVKDVAFAERLLTEAGVATIPLSPFYQQPPELLVLRLCIAKRDETLDEAVARLQMFAKGLEREVSA